MEQPNILPFPEDIVNLFINMTSTDDTPALYRKWAAITMVAGAMERRVWTRVGNRGGQPRRTFPNLYTFLVGAPGVGKYVVEVVQDIWMETKDALGSQELAFHVAPSNMTKASMMDRLAKSMQSFLPPSGEPDEFHSLLVAAEEFGVFLPTYDLDFIGVLNKVYNTPNIYTEERRHGPARELEIVKPIMTILGGVQPAWMATVFPEEAWGMGLTSRIIMIYAGGSDPRDPFAEGMDRPIERIRLLNKLSVVSRLYGELRWEAGASDRLTKWHMAGGPPTPNHSKLEHYLRRRTLHIIKLSIVSSVSRTNKVGSIEVVDVDRAITWLTEAEAVMPDAFRSMIGRSDHQVVEELYNHVVSLYSMSRQSPINESRMWVFLSQRVPTDKVAKIIEAAERSNMIARIAGTDTYIPKPRTEFSE